jgi:uncharacterized protein (DUF433 family)
VLSQDPQVVSGEIVFAGTRVPVWMLFDHIRHGHPLEEFFRGYSGFVRNRSMPFSQVH